MSDRIHTLYTEAVKADEAWSKELVRIFAGRSGDARYDQRGVSTPRLFELRHRFLIAGDAYRAASTLDGFDYHNQAWVTSGRYVRCGHPVMMPCNCYGRIHEGEPAADGADVH